HAHTRTIRAARALARVLHGPQSSLRPGLSGSRRRHFVQYRLAGTRKGNSVRWRDRTIPRILHVSSTPMVFIPTITTLRRTLEFKKYRVYDREDGFDLNIVGIRTHGRKPGRFDDFITVFYRSNGEWILNVFPATTDPGGYWLDHPQSPLGTAILKEGQYLRSYQIGKHKNRYRALVQRA